MNGRLRNHRRPAAVLRLLLLLFWVAPPCAEAQQFVCRPIVRGDTVSGLAQQLTGNGRAAYTPAFQLRDPARRMFVPKSQYRRPLSPHWEACVAIGPATSPLAYAPVVATPPAVAPTTADTAAPPTVTVPPPVRPSSAGPHAGLLFVGTIGSATVMMLLIGAAAGASATARPIPAVLQRVAEDFVTAFTRPLIDSSSSVPPIHTRLRFIRHAQQLEIFIAPGAGRRYPNLVDHKNNVEYDVTRVMRGLGSHVVVSDLRASGDWVVVPIRLSLPAVAATAGSAQRRAK